MVLTCKVARFLKQGHLPNVDFRDLSDVVNTNFRIFTLLTHFRVEILVPSKFDNRNYPTKHNFDPNYRCQGQFSH